MPRPSIDIAGATQKLRAFFREHHRAPSFDEVRELFRYRSKASAHFLVSQLVEKNFLQKDAKGRILWDRLSGVKLLGNIQAGIPTAEEETLTDTMDLNALLVRDAQQTFLLKVSGDSMIEAGIHEGDFVMVERGRQVKDGDIIVAEVDGEWTLKYYESKGSHVRLVPANKKYAPIIPKQELKTGGVIVAVIRKYQ